MICPSCSREFEPKHALRKFCYAVECLAARNLNSVRKAARKMLKAAPPGTEKRRRQLATVFGRVM